MEQERVWCQLNLSLECVTCGGGWVAVQCGLKLFTRCTGSGASQKVQAVVNCYLCSA